MIVGLALAGLMLARPAAAAAYQQDYVFTGGADGCYPQAGLLLYRGLLFGSTTTGASGSGPGTVFSFDRHTGAETVLYNFSSQAADGQDPVAPLIEHHGMLYGTTYGDPSTGNGTVFEMNPDTGAMTILHQFGAATDGLGPDGTLLLYGGALYGTTELGGAAKYGTIFKVDVKSGKETVLHSFLRGSDGAAPIGGMVLLNGVFYGTTVQGGGPGDGGTVFAYNPATRAESVVFAFAGGNFIFPDGEGPYGDLLVHDGLLYGTTSGGGDEQGQADGTVYELDPVTGRQTLLHSFFANGDGASLRAGVVLVGDKLYGTTLDGPGPSQPDVYGDVFEIGLKSHRFDVVHAFQSGTDGASPVAGLVVDGTSLYGVTPDGGTAAQSGGCGTLFRVVP